MHAPDPCPRREGPGNQWGVGLCASPIERIGAGTGRNKGQRSADNRHVFHEMRKLIAVGKICVGDQRSDEDVNAKSESDEPGLVADQHQQAAAKFYNAGQHGTGRRRRQALLGPSSPLNPST
jgi:hypothetical protein